MSANSGLSLKEGNFSALKQNAEPHWHFPALAAALFSVCLLVVVSSFACDTFERHRRGRATNVLVGLNVEGKAMGVSCM